MSARVSNVISNINLANYKQNLLYSNTAAGTGDVAFQALHTHAITAAMASKDRICIHFDGGFAGANGQVGILGVFVDAVQKSGHGVNVNESLSQVVGTSADLVISVGGSVVLVADTDYTKGTAFTLTVKGKIQGGGTVTCYKSQVEGWTT